MTADTSVTKYKIKQEGRLIDGITPVVCIFCRQYITSIEFDIDLHLYEYHRMELVTLPIGKGSLDFRINYAIEEGRMIGAILEMLSKEDKEKLGLSTYE
jgi:hypothetical protein